MAAVFTTSYPRSGSLWLTNLLGDILDGYLQETTDHEKKSPIARSRNELTDQYVIRKTHWSLHEMPYTAFCGLQNKIVFLYRDPRDVAVSAMYYRGHRNLSATIKDMADKDWHGSSNPIYHQIGVYEQYTKQWLQEADANIQYEQLHQDPVYTLKGTFNTLNIDIDLFKIAQAIQRQSFTNAHVAYPHAARKGVVGDWRNHFNKMHGKLITMHLGEMMYQLGYIPHTEWWRTLPEEAGIICL